LKQERGLTVPPAKEPPIRFECRSYRSLSVSLRAQPRDLAVSVHPIVNVCLALEAGISLGSAPGYSATTVQSSSESRTGLKVTFVFCHAALCTQWPQKRTGLVAGLKLAPVPLEVQNRAPMSGIPPKEKASLGRPPIVSIMSPATAKMPAW
jgi:hypothetical protein